MGQRAAEDQNQRDGIVRKIQPAIASFENGGRRHKSRNGSDL